jgi:transcriptional regulator with XRE-family HTH domain
LGKNFIAASAPAAQSLTFSARGTCGVDLARAAERCRLHGTYYSGVERGVRNVSLVNIEKIAKGLRKSLPELFGRV